MFSACMIDSNVLRLGVAIGKANREKLSQAVRHGSPFEVGAVSVLASFCNDFAKLAYKIGPTYITSHFSTLPVGGSYKTTGMYAGHALFVEAAFGMDNSMMLKRAEQRFAQRWHLLAAAKMAVVLNEKLASLERAGAVKLMKRAENSHYGGCRS